MSRNSQQGFAHLALILLTVSVLGLILLSNSQNLAKLQEAQKGDVQGVLIAESGEHSGLGNSGSDNNEHRSESPHSETPKVNSIIHFAKETFHPESASSPKPEGKRDGGNLNELRHEASRSGKQEIEHRVKNEVENEIEKAETHNVELRHGEHGLEVEVHEASGGSRKMEASGSANVIKLNSKNGGHEIEVQLRGEGFRIKVASQSAQTRFPISFDPTTGVLSVQTGSGIKQIRILPDQASDIAKQAGIQQQLGETELVEENDPKTSDEIVFKVSGTRDVKLLGFIPITETLQTEIGAQTGQVLSTNEPWWAKFLSLK